MPAKFWALLRRLLIPDWRQTCSKVCVDVHICMHKCFLWKCGTLFDIISKQIYLLHFYKPGCWAFQLAFYFKQRVSCCSFPAGNGRELISYFGKVSVFFSHKLHFQRLPLLTLSKHAGKEISVCRSVLYTQVSLNDFHFLWHEFTPKHFSLHWLARIRITAMFLLLSLSGLLPQSFWGIQIALHWCNCQRIVDMEITPCTLRTAQKCRLFTWKNGIQF